MQVNLIFFTNSEFKTKQQQLLLLHGNTHMPKTLHVPRYFGSKLFSKTRKGIRQMFDVKKMFLFQNKIRDELPKRVN
jgi:hypothetical protein